MRMVYSIVDFYKKLFSYACTLLYMFTTYNMQTNIPAYIIVCDTCVARADQRVTYVNFCTTCTLVIMLLLLNFSINCPTID